MLLYEIEFFSNKAVEELDDAKCSGCSNLKKHFEIILEGEVSWLTNSIKISEKILWFHISGTHHKKPLQE